MKRKEEAKQVTERRIRVIQWLKKGYTPNKCICKLVEQDGLAESSAKDFVYAINGALNKTNTELMAEAKDYIINALLGVIEECADVNDVKTKLIALKQLSDVTKTTEEKQDINIQFKFGE